MYNSYTLSWLLKYLSCVRYRQLLVMKKLQNRENAGIGTV